jgi:hypothetical protein
MQQHQTEGDRHDHTKSTESALLAQDRPDRSRSGHRCGRAKGFPSPGQPKRRSESSQADLCERHGGHYKSRENQGLWGRRSQAVLVLATGDDIFVVDLDEFPAEDWPREDTYRDHGLTQDRTDFSGCTPPRDCHLYFRPTPARQPLRNKAALHRNNHQIFNSRYIFFLFLSREHPIPVSFKKAPFALFARLEEFLDTPL